MAAKKSSKEQIPSAADWNRGNPILKDSQLSPAALKRVNEIRARISGGKSNSDTTPAPMITGKPKAPRKRKK